MDNFYGILVRNSGSEQIKDVSINYPNTFQSGVGYLSAGGAGKGHGMIRAEIPKTATAVYRTQDGVKHEIKFPLKSQLPKGFRRGQIFIAINSDSHTVDVKYMTDDEVIRRSKLLDELIWKHTPQPEIKKTMDAFDQTIFDSHK